MTAPVVDFFDVYVERQLALHEAFRRLGFPSDDIYVAFFNGGELFTELRQGEFRFRVSISQGVRVDTPAYIKRWTKACEDWNAGLGDQDRIFLDGLEHFGGAVSLLVELKLKGFTWSSTKDLN